MTEERRRVQEAYNKAHGITPGTILRPIQKSLQEVAKEQGYLQTIVVADAFEEALTENLTELEALKKEAVKNLDFEKAAKIRDKINALKKTVVFEGQNGGR